MGVLRGYHRKFSGHPYYRAHRAVIFAVAQLSCYDHYGTGEWARDERNGSGKYRYVNGDVYNGEWRNGRKHGTGTYTYAATGSHYYGQWKHGRQLGYGELVHANHKYYGRFRDNQVTAGLLL